MARFDVRVPYVEPHGNARRYRRIVPPDVAGKVGRRVWIKTFKARTPLAQIEREARRLALEHDSAIALARGQELPPEKIAEIEKDARAILSGDQVRLFEIRAFLANEAIGGLHPEVAAMVNALDHSGRYVPEDLKLTKVYERDREKYGEGRDERHFKQAVDTFVATIGDKDVRAVTRGDASDWIGGMRRDGLQPATIRRRVGPLRALVNRAFLDFDHAGRNPFQQHRIEDGGGKADDRLPFNRDMLALIDSYLATNRRVGHETRDVLRIMRSTGAGPAEVAGLALADVSLDAKVPHVWIRPNAVRGLKTKVRDRRLPLVGEALEVARDAVKRAKARSRGAEPEAVPLFTGFGASGRGADSISAKLNKAIRAAGVPRSPRLVAYSYRHTIKEALRSAGVADHVQRRVLGHAGHGVADRYGSPQGRLAEARDALVAAMAHLGDVDPAIYGARERLPGSTLLAGSA